MNRSAATATAPSRGGYQAMESVAISGLGRKVSVLGFGCLQLGGHGWRGLSNTETTRAVEEAIEAGITLFDTAPIYGLGYSEERLGNILESKRKDVAIATKAGLRWRTGGGFQRFHDASPKGITRDIDASLKRLRTDYIDLYQVHWPDPDTPIEETMAAMDNLRGAGKVRAIGVCNFTLDQLISAQRGCAISSIQVPYSLIDRRIETDLLPYCLENDIAVIAYSPLGRGLLTGKYDASSLFGDNDHRSRPGDEYFGRENLESNLATVRRVRDVARKLGRPPAAVALRWVMQNPAIAVTLFGAKNAFQAAGNIGATGFRLSNDDRSVMEG